MVGKAFISHVTSSPATSAWVKTFRTALERLGLEVFDQRMDVIDLPIEKVERAMRESDLIVMVMTTDTLDAPEFFFEYGIAIWGKKQIFAVIPQEVDPNQLPIPLLRERHVVMNSPEITAGDLLDRLRERQAA